MHVVDLKLELTCLPTSLTGSCMRNKMDIVYLDKYISNPNSKYEYLKHTAHMDSNQNWIMMFEWFKKNICAVKTHHQHELHSLKTKVKAA